MFKGKVSYCIQMTFTVKFRTQYHEMIDTGTQMTMPPPKKGLTSLERLYIIDELYKGFLLMSVKKYENGV